MNSNNPQSALYMAKVRRLAERADHLERSFKPLDDLSDQLDQVRKHFDRFENRFRRMERRLEDI